METRNAKYNENGTIDCEINHPDHEWISFTASPDDTEQNGVDLFAELSSNNNVQPYTSPPPPSPEEVALAAAVKYQNDRRSEYPPIQDQLDMMYWDLVNSTNEWQTLIESIKTKYPKP